MLHRYMMYEKLTVYTDHKSLYWLLTINDHNGSLIYWLLCLAEFDFKVKYIKGKANKQVDALLRLNTVSESFPHDYSDCIPVFLLEETGIEMEFNRFTDEGDFTDVEYN